MKFSKLILILISVLIILSINHAQGRRRGWESRGYGYHGNYIFDLKSPVIIQGQIVKVEKLNLGRGRYSNGVRVVIMDGNKETLVHIGPVAFLKANNLELKEKEKIKIKAFKGISKNDITYFAAEIFKPDKNLVLRDNNGLPMWRRSLNRIR